MQHTVLLRSEIPSGMCTKLRTAAASNNRDHASQSLLLLLARTTHVFTHILFMVNHTINATPPKRLQQHPLLFTTNHTGHTFFVLRLNSARPPHPGRNTILLQSEILSGMCAKLRTAAASNNRDHVSQSLLLLLACATYIMVLFFTHIPFVVNHTIVATPPERLQQHPLLFATVHTNRTFFVLGWTRHDLRILVTAPFCCDWKSRAACAQRFTPGQQATIEIMHCNLSYYCLLAVHI